MCSGVADELFGDEVDDYDDEFYRQVEREGFTWTYESEADADFEEVWANYTRWLDEEDILARIDKGTAPWQQWWVLPVLRELASSIVLCGYAFVEGSRAPPGFDSGVPPLDSSVSAVTATAAVGSEGGGIGDGDGDEGGASTPLVSTGRPSGWVALLGETLTQSDAGSASESSESNLFPLLLMALPVARQGHIEAAAVYCIARTLSSLNTEALAAREGFGVTAFPERTVSAVEGRNTEQTILREALALFEEYFASYSVFTFSVYAIGAVPFVLLALLWWGTASAVGAVIDFAVAYSTPDPLAF